GRCSAKLAERRVLAALFVSRVQCLEYHHSTEPNDDETNGGGCEGDHLDISLNNSIISRSGLTAPTPRGSFSATHRAAMGSCAPMHSARPGQHAPDGRRNGKSWNSGRHASPSAVRNNWLSAGAIVITVIPLAN